MAVGKSWVNIFNVIDRFAVLEPTELEDGDTDKKELGCNDGDVGDNASNSLHIQKLWVGFSYFVDSAAVLFHWERLFIPKEGLAAQYHFLCICRFGGAYQLGIV